MVLGNVLRKSTSPQRNVEVKLELSEDSDSNKSKKIKTSRRSSSPCSSQREDKIQTKTKYRNYRTRNDSDQESDKNEESEIKKEHLPSNLDADSDFSIDSSDSEEENVQKTEKIISNKQPQELLKELPPDDKALAELKVPEDIKKDVKNPEPPKEKKPKIDIWKKRTVGEKFDEAVKRYYERKAQREMGL